MRAEATVPEIRLAVGGPNLDDGHIATVLETLSQTCYYLSVERNRYRFSTTENLIKRYSDRRASISDRAIEERVRAEIQKVFTATEVIERVFFPEKSNAIPDRPALVLAVLAPKHSMEDEAATTALARSLTWECGNSGRTFKSAIIWCVADSAHALREEARKTLAWEAIDAEKEQLHIEDSQRRQIADFMRRAARGMTEAVWQNYRFLLLLGKDNQMRKVDLGLVNSSQADRLVEVILRRLREDGDIEKTISPNFLVRKWPAFAEWSTRAVRDAFFASPEFPRLLSSDTVKETTARGVREGILAYVGKRPDGRYEPFRFQEQMTAEEVQISDETFIITAEEAKKHIEPPKLTALCISPQEAHVKPGGEIVFHAKASDQHGRPLSLTSLPKLSWSAQGGQIDDKGLFKAGGQEGQFVVELAAEGLIAQAKVTIGKEDFLPPPPPPPKVEGKTTRW